MKPVCAITGANGYVGSRLAAALQQDFDIVPLGRNGIAWRLGENTRIAAALRERNVQVLLHSAWDFRHPKAADNWRTNVEGSCQLLDDARAAGVTRLLFISTFSAFENARSNYGRSKLAVEQSVLDAGGTVIRPGLVWGDTPGGVFGALRQQVSKGGIVPLIGSGRYPQYLVHEDDLAEAVRRITLTDAYAGKRLTLAHPRPWLLSDLLTQLAAAQGKQIKLVSIPWRAVFAALKTAETLGLKLNFRSDSLTSLVYQNPAPTFDAQDPLVLRPFEG